MEIKPASAHYTYYIIPHEGATVYQILPSILPQLICIEKEILWEEPLHDALKLEMYKYKQKTTSKENYIYYYEHNNYKTDILDDIARSVMAFFKETDCVYMDIDRADLSFNVANYDHRDALKIYVEKMVQATGRRLKILAIFEAAKYDCLRAKTSRDYILYG
jgi:hypothetical protein